MDGSKGEAPWKETHLCFSWKDELVPGALFNNLHFSVSNWAKMVVGLISKGMEENSIKKEKKKKRNEEEEDNLFSSRFKPTMKSEAKNV